MEQTTKSTAEVQGEIAEVRRLLSLTPASGPFGDGGLGHRLAELEGELAGGPREVRVPLSLHDEVIVRAALACHALDGAAVPIDVSRCVVSGGEEAGLVELAPLAGEALRFRWTVDGPELVVRPWPEDEDGRPVAVPHAEPSPPEAAGGAGPALHVEHDPDTGCGACPLLAATDLRGEWCQLTGEEPEEDDHAPLSCPLRGGPVVIARPREGSR